MIDPQVHLYEMVNQVYNHCWSFRCDVCDLPCSSIRDISIHKVHKHKSDKDHDNQNFIDTLVTEKVQVYKLVQQQNLRPVIQCGGDNLKNIFKFKYLGSILQQTTRRSTISRQGSLKYSHDAGS